MGIKNIIGELLVNGSPVVTEETLEDLDISGSSSVHVGREEPDENYDVWIDPSGEGTSNIVSVVQTTGQSETAVMSQKAVTDLVNSATLGTEDVGSTTSPIYLSAGIPTEISTVDIAHGGTGGSDAATARSNLSVYSVDQITSLLASKSDTHGHPYLSSSTTYAASSSVGGNASLADKLAVIGRVSSSTTIQIAAANAAVRTEEVWFGGSDAVAGGMPMTYCIVVIKKGDNHRTILDCYHLNTGDRYINGCMDTRDTTTYPWTGWKKQPNASDFAALEARVAALEAK